MMLSQAIITQAVNGISADYPDVVIHDLLVTAGTACTQVMAGFTPEKDDNSHCRNAAHQMRANIALTSLWIIFTCHIQTAISSGYCTNLVVNFMPGTIVYRRNICPGMCPGAICMIY